MQQKLTILLALTIVLLTAIDAQISPKICPFGEITGIDPRWKPLPSRFELITELVEGDVVAEISQAFSPYRDAIVLGEMGSSVNFYWNYDTNERFETFSVVDDGQFVSLCTRRVIDGSFETSNVVTRTLFAKPSILLGFDQRNQPNTHWGVRFVGNSNIRGIPTNVFESCYYIADLQATASVFYQFSDSNLFQNNLLNNQSMIIQMDVRIAKSDKEIVSYIYNVLRYIPNPKYRELQQILETPTGVFCQNRTNTLAVPTRIPERFSGNSEVLLPTWNQSIFSSNQLFDEFFQFTRAELWMPKQNASGVSRLAEIHDFAIGLSYSYDYETHQCRVNKLTLNGGDAAPVDGSPALLQMMNPLEAFLSDDIKYQYTGEKLCRERVWCHVWIAEKLLSNTTFIEHREMYWAFEVNGRPLSEWIPIKLVINSFTSTRKLLSSYENNLFNFRENPVTLLEVDALIADCYRAMGPEENFNLGVISFIIANDKEYPVYRNIEALQYTIWEILTVVLQVRPSRISNIIVNHDAKDLPVALTMLDSSPLVGPVEFPPKDPSLAQVIERLRLAIDSNALAFRAKYDTKEVMLRARSDSLKVLYTTFDRNPAQCPNRTVSLRSDSNPCLPVTTNPREQPDNIQIINDTKYKSTGILITSIWIGFVVLGLFIGLISGFFISKRVFNR